MIVRRRMFVCKANMSIVKILWQTIGSSTFGKMQSIVTYSFVCQKIPLTFCINTKMVSIKILHLTCWYCCRIFFRIMKYKNSMNRIGFVPDVRLFSRSFSFYWFFKWDATNAYVILPIKSKYLLLQFGSSLD